MDKFWLDVLKDLTANLFLAIGLIFLNEIIFPKRNVSGEWDADLTCEKTSYEPFKGMSTQYKINLLQQGSVITGHGEKISDINKERGLYTFETNKRVQIEVTGYYERNFLRKSKVYLHVFEKGRLRDTSQTFILVFAGKRELKGRFITTAANASGPIFMNRNDSDL